ncbi:hypothetical protein J25TS5_54680 [Paenibacillus faecis]|uniref:hypothetical protein n=1 Tax=Paenibacillus faecis TaxID=862114 RepID=UPI001B217519|nr:hypothetical protein [Paenibacillus faecis]GIO88536.1 hypothetical protein J25TS5_54680 [Paenibacillus faecis]
MQKKWRTIALTTTITSLLLSSAPLYAAETPAGTDYQQSISAVELDQDVTLRLTSALNKVAPGQQIQFTGVDKNIESMWQINGTLTGKSDAEFIQQYNPTKGRVESTTVYYKAEGLKQVLDPALQTGVSSFLKTFDTGNVFKPEALWRVYFPYQDNEPRNYWVIWGTNQSLEIDLDRNNQITAKISTPISSANSKFTNQANRALKSLGITKTIAFDYAVKYKQGEKEFTWIYRDDNDLNRVVIGAKTGKTWAVVNEFGKDWADDKDFARSFAKPKLSKNQAIAAVKTKASSLFGLNLKGYSVTIKNNEYTFTKKGAPTLLGKINKKGKFYSLELIPANGIKS